MKVFELKWNSIDEKEWIAARTNLEAVKVYLQESSAGYSDFSENCELVELADDQLDKYHILNPDFDEEGEEDSENWETKTFKDAISEMTKPAILCGTRGLGYE